MDGGRFPFDALALDGSFLQGVLLGRTRRALAGQLTRVGVFLLTTPLQFTTALNSVRLRLLRRGLGASEVAAFLEEGKGLLAELCTVIEPGHGAMSEARDRGFKPGKDAELAALALELGVPVLTSDGDFWGRGLATWTSENLASYLESKGLR